MFRAQPSSQYFSSKLTFECHVTYGPWEGPYRELGEKLDRTRWEKSPNKESEVSIGQKEPTPSPTLMPPRTSSIKCFKCLGKGHIASQFPNRSVMIVKDDGEIGNGGSCVNVASERLMKKLAPSTIVHPQPYRLQWLSEKWKLLLDRKVEVMFTLRGYEDRVVYDVVTMEATHLLLRRPWKFDKKVIHDRVTNHFTFIHIRQRVVLNLCLQVRCKRNKRK
ncbi:hypothetical protein CR513_00552, partial [Mucuna pruriens]